jgi:hypothetical protein
MYKYKYKYKYGVPDQGGYGLANDPVATRQAVPREVRVKIHFTLEGFYDTFRFMVRYVDSATGEHRDSTPLELDVGNPNRTLTFDNKSPIVYVVFSKKVLDLWPPFTYHWEAVGGVFNTIKPITCYSVDAKVAKEVPCS